MREIKFRAWHTFLEKMYSVTEIDFKYNKVQLNSPENPEGLTSKIGRTDAILMQFTGLKDKNGKEIYFEDIVKFHFKDYEDSPDKTEEWGGAARIVEDISYGLGLMIDFDYDDDSDNLAYAVGEGGQIEELWDDEELWTLEVIGNIWENPELLEVLSNKKKLNST